MQHDLGAWLVKYLLKPVKAFTATFSWQQWVNVGLSSIGLSLCALATWQLFQLKFFQPTQISAAGFQEIESVTVAVTGAVKQPGLVKLAADSRWADALQAAGGTNSEADAGFLNQELNLAERIQDGQRIYIPFTAERATRLSALDSSPSTLAAESKTTSSTTLDSLISINTSTQEELMTLEGIGEKRAQDIMAGRPYQQLQELTQRAILTATLYAKIQEMIKL